MFAIHPLGTALVAVKPQSEPTFVRVRVMGNGALTAFFAALEGIWGVGPKVAIALG